MSAFAGLESAALPRKKALSLTALFMVGS